MNLLWSTNELADWNQLWLSSVFYFSFHISTIEVIFIQPYVHNDKKKFYFDKKVKTLL